MLFAVDHLFVPLGLRTGGLYLTSGTARFASALSASDFVRRQNVIEYGARQLSGTLRAAQPLLSLFANTQREENDMHRISRALLVAAMLASLAACGGRPKETTEGSTDTIQTGDTSGGAATGTTATDTGSGSPTVQSSTGNASGSGSTGTSGTIGMSGSGGAAASTGTVTSTGATGGTGASVTGSSGSGATAGTTS